MALSRLDASTATIGGVEPVPLFDYNCSGSNGSDMTIGPYGWKPSPQSGLKCQIVTENGAKPSPAMYVLPRRAGPAAATLVELSVWYKQGDHYVVASEEGIADAKANGYVRQQLLGYVWPPPAASNAVSRYALPSMSKDDVTYVAQDYWRGRIWTPMLQLVFWGLSEYKNSSVVRGATDGLVEQSKALLLREWFGFDSNNNFSGAFICLLATILSLCHTLTYDGTQRLFSVVRSTCYLLKLSSVVLLPSF